MLDLNRFLFSLCLEDGAGERVCVSKRRGEEGRGALGCVYPDVRRSSSAFNTPFSDLLKLSAFSSRLATIYLPARSPERLETRTRRSLEVSLYLIPSGERERYHLISSNGITGVDIECVRISPTGSLLRSIMSMSGRGLAPPAPPLPNPAPPPRPTASSSSPFGGLRLPLRRIAPSLGRRVSSL